jgi:hypothetical protein
MQLLDHRRRLLIPSPQPCLHQLQTFCRQLHFVLPGSLFHGFHQHVVIRMRTRPNGVRHPIQQVRQGWVIRVLARVPERGPRRGIQIDAQPQRPFHADLPVSERLIGKELGLWGLLKGEKGVCDARDVLVPQFAVLLAQVLPERLKPGGGIQKLHLAPPVLRLAIGQHPDVRGDAGVVKHVERQCHDSSSQSFSRIQRRMLLSPWPASPVKSDDPLCTSAIRLPPAVLCFILDSLLTRNINCPSLERVIRLNSASPP